MRELIERLRARADHFARRADILRQFADQQAEASYKPTADADADSDEQFAADLRQAVQALSLLPDVEEGRSSAGVEAHLSPSATRPEAQSHSGKEDR